MDNKEIMDFINDVHKKQERVFPNTNRYGVKIYKSNAPLVVFMLNKIAPICQQCKTSKYNQQKLSFTTMTFSGGFEFFCETGITGFSLTYTQVENELFIGYMSVEKHLQKGDF